MKSTTTSKSKDNDNDNYEPIVDREWDREFREWKMEDGPMPGPHPDPKHLWNTNREAYLETKTNPQDLFYNS